MLTLCFDLLDQKTVCFDSAGQNSACFDRGRPKFVRFRARSTETNWLDCARHLQNMFRLCPTDKKCDRSKLDIFGPCSTEFAKSDMFWFSNNMNYPNLNVLTYEYWVTSAAFFYQNEMMSCICCCPCFKRMVSS